MINQLCIYFFLLFYCENIPSWQVVCLRRKLSSFNILNSSLIHLTLRDTLEINIFINLIKLNFQQAFCTPLNIIMRMDIDEINFQWIFLSWIIPLLLSSMRKNVNFSPGKIANPHRRRFFLLVFFDLWIWRKREWKSEVRLSSFLQQQFPEEQLSPNNLLVH